MNNENNKCTSDSKCMNTCESIATPSERLSSKDILKKLQEYKKALKGVSIHNENPETVKLFLEKDVWHYNYMVAVSEEVIPVVVDIINMYAGATMRSSIRSAIEDDIEGETGYRAQFTYNPISGSVYDGLELSVYGRVLWLAFKHPFVTSDKILIEISEADVRTQYTTDTYVYDVDAFLAGRQKEIDAMNMKLKELEAMIDDYNRDPRCIYTSQGFGDRTGLAVINYNCHIHKNFSLR